MSPAQLEAQTWSVSRYQSPRVWHPCPPVRQASQPCGRVSCPQVRISSMSAEGAKDWGRWNTHFSTVVEQEVFGCGCHRRFAAMLLKCPEYYLQLTRSLNDDLPPLSLVHTGTLLSLLRTRIHSISELLCGTRPLCLQSSLRRQAH